MEFVSGVQTGMGSVLKKSERMKNDDFADFGSIQGRLACASIAFAAPGLLVISVVALPVIVAVGLVTAGVGGVIKKDALRIYGGNIVGMGLTLPLLLAKKNLQALAGILHPGACFTNIPSEVKPHADAYLPNLLSAVDALELYESDSSREHLNEHYKGRFKNRCHALFSRDNLFEVPEMQIYKPSYCKKLLEIEAIFAGQGVRVLNEDEKIGVLRELIDSFDNCLGGCGATLRGLSLSLVEPENFQEKVPYWVDNLKQQVVDSIARELSKSGLEYRNISNAIVNHIGGKIGLKPILDASDNHGERQLSREGYNDDRMLENFYAQFTRERVCQYLAEIINDDTRWELRLEFIAQLSEIDPECQAAEERGDDAASLATQKFMFKADGQVYWKFNDAGIQLLAKSHLDAMQGWPGEERSFFRRVFSRVHR